MKEELEKYLESQRKLNEQEIHMREFGVKWLVIPLMIIGCIGIIVGIIGAIFSI